MQEVESILDCKPLKPRNPILLIPLKWRQVSGPIQCLQEIELKGKPWYDFSYRPPAALPHRASTRSTRHSNV